MPDPLVLYSTNTFLKFQIQRDFRADSHYVWCSPFFDGTKIGSYSSGSGQAISSDPANIYKSLHAACKRTDDHDAKINEQKKNLPALASKWHIAGEINAYDRDEIVTMVERATFQDWRPILFVIPFAPVAAKVQRVARPRRASNEPEFIIEDLKRNEFDIIEPSL